MPIWAIDPISVRPQVTLQSWAVFDVPLHGVREPWTRHLMGYALEDQQGQVSSPVIQFDPSSGQCVTKSGRVYRLLGRPGFDPDALYVWQRWKNVASISEESDVTQEVWTALQEAQKFAG